MAHDADGLPDLAGAHDAVKAVGHKLDDYFMRVRLFVFDPGTEGLPNSSKDQFKALGAKLLTGRAAYAAALPLARTGAALPLQQGAGPARADAVDALHAKLMLPLLGDRVSLTKGEWTDLPGRIGAYEVWLAAKFATLLVASDHVTLATMLSCDPHPACWSFLPRTKLLPSKPPASAKSSVSCIARATWPVWSASSCPSPISTCAATLPASGAVRSTWTAAALTCARRCWTVGPNGVCHNRQGCDGDATITKLVEYPISIRQAFWSPCARVVRLLGEQVQKFAAAVTKAGDTAHRHGAGVGVDGLSWASSPGRCRWQSSS